jgi:hypothetical protein
MLSEIISYIEDKLKGSNLDLNLYNQKKLSLYQAYY